MHLGGVSSRLAELRARRRSDPVERLQFLRGFAADRRCGRGRRSKSRGLKALAITVALALAILVGLQGYPRAHSAASEPVHSAAVASGPVTESASQPAAANMPAVWMVDTNGQFDLYSNGLRIENQFAATSEPRRYLAFAREAFDAGRGEWRAEPAGIVFHTTESHMAPFEEDANRTLKRDGEGLLEYVSRRRAYHFVVDRFGRVFRIVRECDYANHAGNSIWADASWVYVNLNQSFFGIAFEAQSSQDGQGPPVNEAQVHAGRVLTEMLRARYQIPAANCVAHAQVSVNPGNRRAGYHIDWAAHLPFEKLGLSDNYSAPIASITLFGFEPDAGLAEAGGAPLARGLERAEEQVRQEAAARGETVDGYRLALQSRYRETLAAQRTRSLAEKNFPQERNP